MLGAEAVFSVSDCQAFASELKNIDGSIAGTSRLVSADRLST
jgi:hypothetical protein